MNQKSVSEGDFVGGQGCRYDDLDDPVAQHMSRDAVVLSDSQSVSSAISVIRDARLTDKVVYVYVLDQSRRLVGVVPIRRFFGADPLATVASIMVSDVVSIPESATVLDACETFLLSKLLALPVVDTDGHFSGVVDVSFFTDEVQGLARRHEAENVFQLIGVHVSLGRDVSPWVSFVDRFPWLLCNIGSGIICAFIAGRYELLISEITVLALFIAVVLALAESVSMQSMTITLQAQATYGSSLRWSLRALRKEFLTSAMIGLGSGLLVGGVVYIWKGAAEASIAVGLSIVLATITACTLGVIVPTLVRAVKADPKIAGGPLALALADIATLLFYFSIADLLLQK